MRQDLPVRFIRINEASKEASESICPENKDGTLFCDDGISHGTPVQPQPQAMETVLREPQDSEITSGIV